MEQGKPARRNDTVSASELAQMGVCERLVRYEARYGKRMSANQRKAIERGRREHDQFFRDAAIATPGVQTSLEKPWCFIASVTYGQMAPETQTLRQFRDQVLRQTAVGRRLIRLYYRMSPRLAAWLAGRETAVFVSRILLRPAVVYARVVVKMYRRRLGSE